MPDENNKASELLKEGVELAENVDKDISGLRYRPGYSRCCNARIIKTKGGLRLSV